MASANPSPPRSLTAAVWLLLAGLVPWRFTDASTTNGIVLWNKLDEVDRTGGVVVSEIGHNFTVEEYTGGTIDWERNCQGVVLDINNGAIHGKFGGAIATTGGCGYQAFPAGGYLSMDPGNFFPLDMTKGTIEMWVQKRLQKITPYKSPLVTFFGRTYFSKGYDSIRAMWGNTPNGLSFSIYVGPGYLTVSDTEWEDVNVGVWVHLAFVWNGQGIDGPGSDTMRIYRDNNVVTSTQVAFSTVPERCCCGEMCGPGTSWCGTDPCSDSENGRVRVLTMHWGSRNPNCNIYDGSYPDTDYPCLCDDPTVYPYEKCPFAYMDNMIVWDHAKMDFSSRFYEEGNSPPLADAGIDQVTYVGATVLLDGTSSDDKETAYQDLAFTWSFSSKPSGSQAELNDPIITSPSFVVDMPGEYLVQLEVSDDGEGGYSGVPSSATDVMVVRSLMPKEYIEDHTTEVLQLVELLDEDSVLNAGAQQALCKKLEAAIKHIEDGKVKQAIKKIEKALERMDGVVLRGQVDDGNDGYKKDTITDPEIQQDAYETLFAALEAAKKAMEQ